MKQEKIEKVLELCDKRYSASRDYNNFNDMLATIKDFRSQGSPIQSFLTYLSESLVMSRISKDDYNNLQTQLYLAAENAWAEICAKQLSILKDIEKELAEL